MKSFIPVLPALVLAMACTPEDRAIPRDPKPSTESSDLRLGNGYRGADDPCRRVGETEMTASLIDRDTDLVGCPIDFAGRADFIRGTGAIEAARTAEWVLYRVPLVGDAPMTDIPPTPAITGG